MTLEPPGAIARVRCPQFRSADGNRPSLLSRRKLTNNVDVFHASVRLFQLFCIRPRALVAVDDAAPSQRVSLARSRLPPTGNPKKKKKKRNDVPTHHIFLLRCFRFFVIDRHNVIVRKPTRGYVSLARNPPALSNRGNRKKKKTTNELRNRTFSNKGKTRTRNAGRKDTAEAKCTWKMRVDTGFNSRRGTPFP